MSERSASARRTTAPCSCCRPRARLEALHRLNLNPGLASNTQLMELVLCGEPSYEEAKASYLADYRPPFLLSSHAAELMDRAEYLAYMRGDPLPLRVRFQPAVRSSYNGFSLIVDLNASDDFKASAELLHKYDELGYRTTANTLYEHARALDCEGHMCAGYQAIVLGILQQNLLGLHGAGALELVSVVKQLVVSDLQVQHVIEINTSSFRDLCEGHVRRNNGDRSIKQLLKDLSSYSLSDTSTMPGTDHGVLSLNTLKVTIEEHLRSSHADRVHVAIVRTTGGPPDNKLHHFFTLWCVDGNVCVS